MYSRSTRGKVFGGSVKSEPLRAEVKNSGSFRRSVGENNEKVVLDKPKIRIPEPPPNYGGTVCGGVELSPLMCEAEGIERLVNNDLTYGERMAERKSRTDVCGMPGKGDSQRVDEVDRTSDDKRIGGLKRMADALGNRMFEPEDVLLCAMIMLMLNSSSEDDIIMIIVLMMLL